MDVMKVVEFVKIANIILRVLIVTNVNHVSIGLMGDIGMKLMCVNHATAIISTAQEIVKRKQAVANVALNSKHQTVMHVLKVILVIPTAVLANVSQMEL